MNKEYDKGINKELFSVDFQSDFSEDEVNRLSDIAKKLINEYGEQIVFDEWFQYLKESINGRYPAWNFMIAFYNFDGHNLKVKDPYPFLGLLFNRLGLSLNSEPFKGEEETIFDTFDSIYVALLTKSGIIKQDDYFSINLYSDNRFKKAVEDNEYICPKCGTFMIADYEKPALNLVCPKCGTKIATTKWEEIDLDDTNYEIILKSSINSSMDQIRFVSNLTGQNFIASKKLLEKGGLLLQTKAIDVKNVIADLNQFGVEYYILPDFPY